MHFKMIAISLLSVSLFACSNTQRVSSTENIAQTTATTADIQKVKGLNDFEREIVGKPNASSKFTQLKIGMSIQQVKSLIGEPSDQGEYETGKRWIPFYYGDDMRRTELVYKEEGKLTFASGSVFGSDGRVLIRITHNPNEVDARQ